MKSFATRILFPNRMEDYPIEIEYFISKNIPQLTIPNEVHRALFLVVKEAVTNLAKHSKATKIGFETTITKEKIIITITDNGIGFQNEATNGNGLLNM